MREQPVGVGAHRLDVQTGSRRFAAERCEPLEVLLERERPPVVDADHLEHAVTAQQPSSVAGIVASAASVITPSSDASGALVELIA